MEEKRCFYTFVSDNYYEGIGTPILINSFKKFHPDIELIVFRQDTVDKVFKETSVNFENAKPTFAKLLTDSYDLVVNIDADTIVTERLEEILKDDYEVGSVVGLSNFCHAFIENVTPEMYVQAGLVASRNPKFWDIWEEANKGAMKYHFKENDVLNLVWYNDSEVSKMGRKIFDKEKDYYGCKSLGREKEFYIEKDKLMCRGEQVFCYHNAKGHYMPKLQFDKMEFIPEVVEYLNKIAQKEEK